MGLLQEGARYREVQDHPKAGQFSVEILIEGEDPQTQQVVPIDVADWQSEAHNEYLQKQFHDGALFATFRYGEKGVCDVQANETLVEVMEITRVTTDYKRYHFSSEKFYERHHVDGIGGPGFRIDNELFDYTIKYEGIVRSSGKKVTAKVRKSRPAEFYFW